MSSGKKKESVKEEKESVKNDEKGDDVTNEGNSRDENENKSEASPSLDSDTSSCDSDFEDELLPETYLDDMPSISQSNNRKRNKHLNMAWTQTKKALNHKKKGNPDQGSDTSSSDSDSDGEQRSTPKTLEDLGIKLNQSNRKWRSHKDLMSRQLGFISPVLFTRNVAGSVNLVERLQLEKNLDGHRGCVNTLNFNSSGDLLVSGSDDLDVVVWNWGKGKEVIRYESGHSGNVFQVSCGSMGPWVCCCTVLEYCKV